MAKFRVGEKVRFIEPKAYCAYVGASDPLWPKVGDTGEVIGHVYRYVLVRLDNEKRALRTNGGGGWRFLDEWLEPAQEGPKDRLRESAANTLRFAVGDKVVIAGCDQIGYLEACGAKVGDVGVIYEMGGLYDYKIRFDGNRERVALNDAELTPYVEPAKPVAYSVGDRVKVRRTYELHEVLVAEGAKQVDTGVVEVGNNDALRVRYDSNGGCDTIGKGVEVLEVLSPAKPALLAAGTLVRLTDIGFKRWGASYFHAGSTGTIIGYNNGNDTMPYRVKFDDEPTNHVWNMEPDSIEPVVPGDFRVGDKVRVVKNVFSPTYDYYVGHVGVVRSVINGRGEIDVVFDGLGKTAYCKPEEIELVASNTPIEPFREPAKTTPASEKKREFRVGDKVRVIGESYKRTRWYHDVGVVYRPDDGDGIVCAKFERCGGGGFFSHELELIAATTKPVAPTKTIAVSNLRFTRKGERIVVEANGKRVATVSVEELRKMSDEMTKEDVAQ